MKTLAATKPHHFVFTSNVDSHWVKAGFDETKLMECHGSTAWMQCTDTECSADDSAPPIWSAADVIKSLRESPLDETTFRAAERALPKCVKCGKLARPNVMMFGDFSFVEDRLDGQEQNFQKFVLQATANKWKVTVIEIGAGEAVPTVRYTSERLTALPGATLIRINPRDPQVPPKLVKSAISIPAGGLWTLDQIMVHIDAWSKAKDSAAAAIAADQQKSATK